MLSVEFNGLFLKDRSFKDKNAERNTGIGALADEVSENNDSIKN